MRSYCCGVWRPAGAIVRANGSHRARLCAFSSAFGLTLACGGMAGTLLLGRLEFLWP